MACCASSHTWTLASGRRPFAGDQSCFPPLQGGREGGERRGGREERREGGREGGRRGGREERRKGRREERGEGRREGEEQSGEGGKEQRAEERFLTLLAAKRRAHVTHTHIHTHSYICPNTYDTESYSNKKKRWTDSPH